MRQLYYIIQRTCAVQSICMVLYRERMRGGEGRRDRTWSHPAPPACVSSPGPCIALQGETIISLESICMGIGREGGMNRSVALTHVIRILVRPPRLRRIVRQVGNVVGHPRLVLLRPRALVAQLLYPFLIDLLQLRQPSPPLLLPGIPLQQTLRT